MKRYLFSFLLVAGCFKVDVANGVLLCNHNGKQCPDGYHCAVNDACYKNGEDPDLSAAAEDLAGTDQFNSTDGPAPVDLLASTDGDAGPLPDLLPPPDLTPIKHQGDPCTAGVDVCETGHCIDGYCCDSDCTDPCAACDVTDKLGMCSPVTGPTHGSRSCNGSGTCGGKCNGTATTCTYASASTICGAACDGHCDANGGCTVGTGGSCANGFACGSNACLTSCSTDNDCQQPNFKCQAPNCVRVPESDCLDGVDNNGDGKIDCDDPTCTTVECVPAPGTGNEIGLLSASGCSAPGYTTSEPQNQQLNMPTCQGCSCSSSVVCQETGKIWFDNSGTCSRNDTFVSFAVDSAGSCVSVANHNYYADEMSGPTVKSASCSPSGSPSLPDPDFAIKKTFCATPSISRTSCGGDTTKVCVPKPPQTTVLCVRVPGTSGSCPPGYGTTSDIYYSTFARGSCGACGGCSTGASNCTQDHQAIAYYNAGCTGNIFAVLGGTSPSIEGVCSSSSLDNGGSGTMVQSIKWDSYSNGVPLGGSVSCGAPSVTTNYATPAGGSLICCQ